MELDSRVVPSPSFVQEVRRVGIELLAGVAHSIRLHMDHMGGRHTGSGGSRGTLRQDVPVGDELEGNLEGCRADAGGRRVADQFAGR